MLPLCVILALLRSSHESSNRVDPLPSRLKLLESLTDAVADCDVDRHASLKARPYPIDFGGKLIQLVIEGVALIFWQIGSFDRLPNSA